MYTKEDTMKETYFSIDISTVGPYPDVEIGYSMGSISAYVIGTGETFFVLLKPMNENFTNDAVEKTGLTIGYLKEHGEPIASALSNFTDWIHKNTPTGHRPVMASMDAPFDWMFLNWYLLTYSGKNPFGKTCVDIRSYFMGMNSVSLSKSTKKYLRNHTMVSSATKDCPMNIAIEQGKIFQTILIMNRDKYLKPELESGLVSEI